MTRPSPRGAVIGLPQGKCVGFSLSLMVMTTAVRFGEVGTPLCVAPWQSPTRYHTHEGGGQPPRGHISISTLRSTIASQKAMADWLFGAVLKLAYCRKPLVIRMPYSFHVDAQRVQGLSITPRLPACTTLGGPAAVYSRLGASIVGRSVRLGGRQLVHQRIQTPCAATLGHALARDTLALPH